MNRLNRLNSINSIFNIRSLNLNNQKRLFLNTNINSISSSTTKKTTLCLNQNNNNNIISTIQFNKNRLFSTSSPSENKNDEKLKKEEEKEEVVVDEQEPPHPGITKPAGPFSMNLEKYKTNETIDDQNPDHLVYQSNREKMFKAAKYFLTTQSLLGVSSPIIAYINHLEMKTVLFLSVFSFWALSFQLIGQKMASCFGMRIYREPGSPFIKLCHLNPSMTVLKIPIEDIQLSKFSEKGTPYILLENGALFFFEQSGDLLNTDEFAYILSGEEHAKKMKKLEQDEYKKYFETSSTTTEDLENTNKLIDLEMDLINKKLEDAKKEQEKEKEKEKENK